MKKTTLSEDIIFEIDILRNCDSINRVKSLIDLYNTLVRNTKGRKDIKTSDLLRSAVVFLHATLEEYMRVLGRIRIPNSAEEVLNKIPLIMKDGTYIGEKFTLATLTKFKTKSIDNFLEDTIDTYLSYKTFNNTNDLAAHLKYCGLNPNTFDDLFPQLSSLMKRRHQIVHRADLNPKRGNLGHHDARSINKKSVEVWLQSVVEFRNRITKELVKK